MEKLLVLCIRSRLLVVLEVARLLDFRRAEAGRVVDTEFPLEDKFDHLAPASAAANTGTVTGYGWRPRGRRAPRPARRPSMRPARSSVRICSCWARSKPFSVSRFSSRWAPLPVGKALADGIRLPVAGDEATKRRPKT